MNRNDDPEYYGAGSTSGEAVKFDAGKPMMGLISSKFLVGLAKVLTFGAKKYAAHNWRKGMAFSKAYNALQRHLVAFNDGEDLDVETGLCHLDHAACELMFLRELWELQPKHDDRYKSQLNADHSAHGHGG